MGKRFWVYIITNEPFGTLYIGVTNNLTRRIYEHREGQYEGFSKDHGLNRLVYYEEYPTALEAIEREKKLKKWRRDWKKRIIGEFNPAWDDLYMGINQ